MKKRAHTGHFSAVSSDGKNFLMGEINKKKAVRVEEEEKIPIDSGRSGSNRDRAGEQALAKINEGYMQDEAESANVTAMLKQGVKNKNGLPAAEKSYAPFV